MNPILELKRKAAEARLANIRAVEEKSRIDGLLALAKIKGKLNGRNKDSTLRGEDS